MNAPLAHKKDILRFTEECPFLILYSFLNMNTGIGG